MENNEQFSEKSKSNITAFIIFRIVVALLIVLALTAIKFINYPFFNTLKSYYNDSYKIDINAEYYLGGSNDKN